jgi:hypothetical protein
MLTTLSFNVTKVHDEARFAAWILRPAAFFGVFVDFGLAILQAANCISTERL